MFDDPVDPSKRAPAEEIFFSALEVPIEERQAFVEKACAGSQELRAEVESLLAGYASDRMPEELDAASAAALFEAAGAGMEGWRIGPYRIVREIGRGGMGAVYLAERADGSFEQRVALKLIKRGMDSEAILDRFLRERQILARLEHPNIARLLDGGVAEDGRPYLVMEYVSGRALVAYCDEEGIDVEGRLELFTEVCRAVQHAHRNLVVHRDLKPSNVLVTETGRVKLLDFGIAKLLSEEADAAATALTREGSGVLTPQFAAPEQVLGEPATTATDVYALGLVLYELLTGELPYAVVGGDAVRVVCETEPVPPSRAVSGSDRGRRRLRRSLQGDLDTIVLKALRKEPERRYASAEALLQDLRRYRSGLPVEARPDTLGYRASRFVKRHAVGVVASGLVGLSLVGGLGVALWQTSERAEQARRAEESATRAEGEAAKAEQMVTVLTDIFSGADPYAVGTEELSARELLDAGAARIRDELVDQPQLQATMLATVGRIYRRIGAYAPARALLAQAMKIHRTHLKDDRLGLADTLLALAATHKQQGGYDRAEPLLLEALAIRELEQGPDHLAVSDVLNVLADLYTWRGQPEEAEPLYDRVLEIRRTQLGPDAIEVALTLHGLGVLQFNRGRYDEAMGLHREELRILEAHHETDHPDVANAHNSLAAALGQSGRLSEAEHHLSASLGVRERLFGDRHPHTAMSLHNLGLVLTWMERYDEAEPLLERALAAWTELFGQRHPEVARCLGSLGELYLGSGRLDEAEQQLRQAIEIWTDTAGTDVVDIAAAMDPLVQILDERGRVAEARLYAERAVAIWEQHYGSDHAEVVEGRQVVEDLRRRERPASSTSRR